MLYHEKTTNNPQIHPNRKARETKSKAISKMMFFMFLFSHSEKTFASGFFVFFFWYCARSGTGYYA
jgi:hypothetical protein